MGSKTTTVHRDQRPITENLLPVDSSALDALVQIASRGEPRQKDEFTVKDVHAQLIAQGETATVENVRRRLSAAEEAGELTSRILYRERLFRKV